MSVAGDDLLEGGHGERYCVFVEGRVVCECPVELGFEEAAGDADVLGIGGGGLEGLGVSVCGWVLVLRGRGSDGAREVRGHEGVRR